MLDYNDRYSRQRLIPGWNQECLSRARVMVVGTGLLAQFISSGIAGLGIGQIIVVDQEVVSRKNHLGLLRLHARHGHPRAHALAWLLRKINPQITVAWEQLPLLYEECFRLVPTLNLIIEATNSPGSKYACLRYSQKWGIPVIFAAAGPTIGRLSVHLYGRQSPLTEEEYCCIGSESWPQDPITGMVIAGLVLEEARKVLMPLEEPDQPIERMLVYNRQSTSRFNTQMDHMIVNEAYGGHCVLVGAGALGNWLGIALVLSSGRAAKLTVIDYDRIEYHNLNRQVLFYKAVGREKAPELAQKLQKLNPEVECEAVVAQASEAYFRKHKPDLVFAAVDNFEARALLHRIALKHQIPLINGGTSPTGGRMTVYHPGITACLDCQSAVERRAREERAGQRARESCAQVPEPSVVITNMIVAGLMAGEAGCVLKPQAYGPPVKGIIEYSALEPVRIGLHSLKEPCHCHEMLTVQEGVCRG